MPKLVEISADCISSIGLNDEELKQVTEWKLENNEQTKKLLYCFASKLNNVDKKGHVIVDEGVKLAVSKKRAAFGDAIKKCNHLEGSDKYDTLFKISICVRDKENIFLRF